MSMAQSFSGKSIDQEDLASLIKATHEVLAWAESLVSAAQLDE